MLMRAAGWLAGTTGLIGAGLVGFSWWTARRVEAAVPPAGHFLQIDGQTIHFTDSDPFADAAASKPAIVLIHGLGGQLLNFPKAGLAELQRDFRIVAVDRPGNGYSRRRRNAPANIRAQAATLARLIAALRLDRPLVVGHSLGGAIALAVALDHPDCVGGLALVAPLTHAHAGPVPPPFRRLVVRSLLLRLLIAWTVAIPSSIRNSRRTLAVVFGPDAVPSNFGIAGGGLLSLRPSSYYAASSDLVAINDDLPGLVPRYAGLTIPVGVLFGTADRVLDPALHGQALADKLPGLDLEFIEGGGHMTPVTAPARTAAFIRRQAGRITNRHTGASVPKEDHP